MQAEDTTSVTDEVHDITGKTNEEEEEGENNGKQEAQQKLETECPA